MKKYLYMLIFYVSVALGSLPISFIVTILLFPLWSWVEKRFGIESVGHSGPAEWCYWVMTMVIFISIVSVDASRKRV